MNKQNYRSAAGSSKSAVAERIRLREEWSALKGTDDPKAVVKNKQVPKIQAKRAPNTARTRNASKQLSQGNDVLRGVVALVEVGAESRALILRAALGALGASVVPQWSPLVTHLVWAHGGCRATRAKARALASRLVSPLWVEACAAAGRRLPEHTFPAAARESDLPSPRTLTRLLKKAEMENVPLVDLLSDSKEDVSPSDRRRNTKPTRDSTDSSTEADTSRDTIGSEDVRVNTAPRRAQPMSTTPPPPPPPRKPIRRKLFTQREAPAHQNGSSTDSDDEPSRREVGATSVGGSRQLARAERMARRVVAQGQTSGPTQQRPTVNAVLTGMSRSEREVVTLAVNDLHGRVQPHVDKHTTHVLLGSCKSSNVAGVGDTAQGQDVSEVVIRPPDIRAARTLNALLGAARGCAVVHAQWALDSHLAQRWLHAHTYEVPHLNKISRKARVERKALGLMRVDYGYDVFHGMCVQISSDVPNRKDVIHLLQLCSAIVVDENGFVPRGKGMPENYYLIENLAPEADLMLGSGSGSVNPKWVFDSVAATRMRTTRNYITSSMNCE